MLYSVADIINGEGAIIIYEEKMNGITYMDEIEMEKQLSAMFNQKYKEAIGGKLIGVEYKVVDSKTFDLIQEVSGTTQGNIKDTAIQIMNKKGLDLSQEEKDNIINAIDKVMPYVFNWKMYNTTAYNFYDMLGLLD